MIRAATTTSVPGPSPAAARKLGRGQAPRPGIDEFGGERREVWMQRARDAGVTVPRGAPAHEVARLVDEHNIRSGALLLAGGLSRDPEIRATADRAARGDRAGAIEDRIAIYRRAHARRLASLGVEAAPPKPAKAAAKMTRPKARPAASRRPRTARTGELFDLAQGRPKNTLVATATREVLGDGKPATFEARATGEAGAVFLRVAYADGGGIGVMVRRGDRPQWPFEDVVWQQPKQQPKKAAPPARSRSRARDGLDAMADRDLNDLAVEYMIPPVGLGTADRASLVRRLREAGAVSPQVRQAERSRRPSVGLRVSLLLNKWANGDGPDDPLAEGFTREQLRQTARSRGITLRRGANEATIRQALYDSVVSSARKRRAEAGDLPDVGSLFEVSQPRMQAEIARVFEGDFAGLTTHVEATNRQRYNDLAGRGGEQAIFVRGSIRDAGGRQVGTFSRQIHRNPDGTMTVYHAFLQIDGSTQGNGFSNAFNGHLIRWYRDSGVKAVTVHANIDVGGYTWASFGYNFADEGEAVEMIDHFRDALRQLRGGDYTGRRLRGSGMNTSDQVNALQDLLDRTQRYRFGQPGFPTAYEFSQAGRWEGAGGRSDVWIGKALMLGTSWHGKLDLTTTPSPSGR